MFVVRKFFISNFNYFLPMSSGDEVGVIFIVFVIIGAIASVAISMSAFYKSAITGDPSYVQNSYWIIGITWAVIIVIIVIIAIVLVKSNV
ncbi:MAG: hypothetical protein ACTSRP_13015 [Candidatus Helarchaeota archaeon]